MNPQDIRNPTQQMKLREAYLANLELEQRNLKKTEDAVKSLKQTGQVALEPQDTRTLNEKLADVQKLKISLRKELLDITDGAQASLIMNTLTDQEIQGLSLVSGDVIPTMKKTYLKGVPAPIFVEYVRRYLKDYSTNLGLASGNQNAIVSELKLTRDMLQRTMPSPAILDELVATIRAAPPSAEKDQAMEAAITLSRSLPNIDDIAAAQSSLSQVELSNLSKLISDALETVPSGSQVQKLTKDIINALRGGSPKQSSDILNKTIQTMKIQQDELDHLRSISEAIRQEGAEALVPQIERLQVPASEVDKIARIVTSRMKNVQVPTGEKKVTRTGREVPAVAVERQLVGKRTINAADLKLAQEILKLEMASADEIAADNKLTKDALVKYWDYISKRYTRDELSKIYLAELRTRSKDELKQLIIDSKFGNDPVKEMEGNAKNIDEQIRKALEMGSPKEEAQATASQTGGVSPNPNITDVADADIAANRLMSEQDFDQLSVEDKLQYTYQMYVQGVLDRSPDLKLIADDIFRRKDLGAVKEGTFNNLYSQYKRVLGMGMKAKRRSKGQNIVYGCGLAKSASKKQFVEKIDFSEGFPADKSYIPFGRYVVHKHKLSGGILQVRTIKGGAIPKLPTLGISPSLGGIIKKMMGGSLPSYDEMSALTEDDKNTLYKVFKLSQIDKADLLPSPDKTKEEQEMNQFQILKGQIQAGNNSGELIKEFKRLLMKFISGGKIPRGQGMDIICELMALGY